MVHGGARRRGCLYDRHCAREADLRGRVQHNVIHPLYERGIGRTRAVKMEARLADYPWLPEMHPQEPFVAKGSAASVLGHVFLGVL